MSQDREPPTLESIEKESLVEKSPEKSDGAAGETTDHVVE